MMSIENNLSDIELKRIAITTSSSDASRIPKVENAGKLLTLSDGSTIQIMHNGLRVLADQYYGSFNTKIIEGLNGHHEPQEELVFFEVLKNIEHEGTMMELGSYWGYYSLWFSKEVKNSKNYLIEADTKNLEVGIENFQINGFEASFENGFIGSKDDHTKSPPILTVDALMEKYSIGDLDILHSDIQGAEFQMLLGSKSALKNKRINYFFISTHSNLVHQKCLDFLRKHDYIILVSHTIQESVSVDGLIVASSKKARAINDIKISRRPFARMSLKEIVRQILFLVGYYKIKSLFS